MDTTENQTPDYSKVDLFLQLADDALVDPSERRIPLAMMFLSALRVRPTARLAYRPQPAPSLSPPESVDVGGVRLTSDGADISYAFLILDCQLLSKGTSIHLRQWIKLGNEGTQNKPHFLTYLDAYNYLPLIAHTDEMRARVDVIRELVEHYDHNTEKLKSHYISQKECFYTRTLMCTVFAFRQRLLFYRGRMEGRSVETMRIEMDQTASALGLPEDWDNYEELAKASTHWEAEINRHRQLLSEDVELEWVSDPIPVEDISTPTPTPNTDCPVCCYKITPPSVRTEPCKHAFCKGCLETWIHACQKASHKCPLCRTQLFPEPEYRAKPVPNYQDEIVRLNEWLVQTRHTMASSRWLKEELTFQRVWELETDE